MAARRSMLKFDPLSHVRFREKYPFPQISEAQLPPFADRRI